MLDVLVWDAYGAPLERGYHKVDAKYFLSDIHPLSRSITFEGDAWAALENKEGIDLSERLDLLSPRSWEIMGKIWSLHIRSGEILKFLAGNAAIPAIKYLTHGPYSRAFMDEDDLTKAMVFAASRGHAFTVQFFLDEGVPLHHHDPDAGYSYKVLEAVVEVGCPVQIFRMLCDAYVGSDEFDEEVMEDVAEEACSRDELEIYTYLRAAFPGSISVENIRSAAENSSMKVLDLILSHGVDQKEVDYAFFHACNCGAIEAMKYLVAYGATVKSRDLANTMRYEDQVPGLREFVDSLGVPYWQPMGTTFL